MKTDGDVPTSNRLPGGPRTPLPLFWNLAFKKNYGLWTFLEENRVKYGDIARVPLLSTTPTFQVTDPDLIGKLLMGTEKTNRKTVFIERMKKVGGNGILLASGETWRVNRRLANPAFHPRMLDNMRKVIEEEVAIMMDDWDIKIVQNPIVNISAEMSKLMLNTIVRILFTTDFKRHAEVIVDAMGIFQDYSSYIYYNPFDLPLWVPIPIHRRLKKVIRLFDEVTFEVINEHRQNPDRYKDLLSVYLSTVDEETGARMSDQQLRDEVLTLMVAGHETTAASLSMGFYALSSEPAVTEKIVRDNDDQNLYTGRVQQEILRLYPAAWGITRELVEALEFKGVNYPVGTNFLLLQQHMHRHPDHWDRPEVFDPDRFLPENSKGRHPFAYFPFGGGVRNCIGMGLAKMEMTTVLARFLKRFHMEAVPTHTHILKPQLSTTPLPYVALKVTKREGGMV